MLAMFLATSGAAFAGPPAPPRSILRLKIDAADDQRATEAPRAADGWQAPSRIALHEQSAAPRALPILDAEALPIDAEPRDLAADAASATTLANYFEADSHGANVIPVQAQSGVAQQGSSEYCQPSTLKLRSIGELTPDISAPAGGGLPDECPIANQSPYTPRDWAETHYLWRASSLCHKPLYFEEVALERYGHSWGAFLQPVASGAHFFGTIPVLPYKMGIEAPNECIYALGYYRPGSCAPQMLGPVPISARGALWQAGAVAGGVFLLP